LPREIEALATRAAIGCMRSIWRPRHQARDPPA
jgi:hypothetical protein